MINPSTILYVCGKLPTSSSVFVVISIFGDCVDGGCPPPTPTPTSTPTPTPTCDPSAVHPYNTPFGSSTNITGYFYTSFLSACTAFNCVTGGTCGVNAFFSPYLDNSEPQIGSILYNNITGCDPTSLTGYFLVKIGGSPTYNAIAEVTAGVVTDLPSCP
jgi:hypothetical protein